MKRWLNVLLQVVAMSTPVFAYDLQPSTTSKLLKDPVHEMLSIASVKCKKAMLTSSSMRSIESWNCLEDVTIPYNDSDKRWADFLRVEVKKAARLDPEVQYLLAGVRWPDDPTGLLRSNIPIQGLLNFIQCKSWLGGSYGSCSNRFCSSHFGHAQMAHSMRLSAPWCDSQSPDSTTCILAAMNPRLAIEAWVRWLIPIGQGKVGPSDEVFDNDPLAKIFFDQENCDEVYPPGFTYKYLFFVDCSKGRWKKLFKFWKWGESWGKCPIVAPESPDELEAALKKRAIGAILHVIQDSYARGHTLRVPMSTTDSCSSRISCTKITAFSDYTKQKRSKHEDADKTPIWDASCFKERRSVDDPITAGAKVLAMFENGSSADSIWCYLSDRVFVTTSPEEEKLSKDNECFGRD